MVQEQYISYKTRQIFIKEYYPDNIEEKKAPVVICSHGFNGSYEHFDKECLTLMEHGIGAVCFDFCGGAVISKSSGDTTQMTLLTEKEDLRAVLDYVAACPYVDKERIYLFGASQGGAVSALVAEEESERIAGLMLLFPALCIADDWQRKYAGAEQLPEIMELWDVKLGRIFYETVKDWDMFQKIGKYNKRVLIFHGDADETVSVDYGRRAASTYPMAYYREFPGEKHGFTEEGRDEVIKEILDFVKEEEALQVHVKITECHTMKNQTGQINMILFDGTAQGNGFRGEILSGGVDTQQIVNGMCTLSARYMIKGVDAEGNETLIFVDNTAQSAVYGITRTKACIKTDSKSLESWNDKCMTGYIGPAKDKEKEDIIIHLYC